MKLLFDNNLSTKLPDALTDYFPDSKHVSALQMEEFSDRGVFEFAKGNNFVIVTKDKDFYDIIDLLRKNVKPITDFISGNKSLMVLDH